jgi:hypothetical protein
VFAGQPDDGCLAPSTATQHAQREPVACAPSAAAPSLFINPLHTHPLPPPFGYSGTVHELSRGVDRLQVLQ